MEELINGNSDGGNDLLFPFLLSILCGDTIFLSSIIVNGSVRSSRTTGLQWNSGAEWRDFCS